MDLDQFQNPPKTYREAPFWSWNDDLDPQELVRQIGLMDEAGVGVDFAALYLRRRAESPRNIPLILKIRRIILSVCYSQFSSRAL